MDPANAAQLFTHLRILMGTVIGLGIGRLLIGFGGLIQHPGRAKLSAIHLIWAGSILLTLVHFWWWEFALFTITNWSFGDFLFLVAYCIVLFMLCVLLFPDNIDEYDGYEDFFMSRRAWFFGLFAVSVVFDVFDSSLKGWDYFATFDIEYAIEVPVALLLCVVGMRTRSPRFHLALALVQLLYQLSWIVRAFLGVA